MDDEGRKFLEKLRDDINQVLGGLKGPSEMTDVEIERQIRKNTAPGGHQDRCIGFAAPNMFRCALDTGHPGDHLEAGHLFKLGRK